MDINATNTGASTYAMKKAMEMPKLMLDLVQQTSNVGKQSLNTESLSAQQAPDIGSISVKGKIIDIVA